MVFKLEKTKLGMKINRELKFIKKDLFQGIGITTFEGKKKGFVSQEFVPGKGFKKRVELK